MKRKLLYPLGFITASLGTGLSLAIPLSAVPAGMAEQAEAETDPSRTRPPPTDG